MNQEEQWKEDPYKKSNQRFSQYDQQKQRNYEQDHQKRDTIQQVEHIRQQPRNQQEIPAIPLLVQFVIYPNKDVTQPEILPLTMSNLNNIYEQLKQIVNLQQNT